MNQIIEAQGAVAVKLEPGALTYDVKASETGTINRIDCLRLNRLARTAGAPVDAGAGIDLRRRKGDTVTAGDVLYRIHACESSGFDMAVEAAGTDSGYVIG
jgi:thymidine phosphorylase